MSRGASNASSAAETRRTVRSSPERVRDAVARFAARAPCAVSAPSKRSRNPAERRAIPPRSGTGAIELPHRDVLLARRRDRRPIPVGPSLAQAHPGEASHEVELGRVRVTDPHWIQAHAVLSHDQVVRMRVLRERVVHRHLDLHLVERDACCRYALTAVPSHRIRDERLHREHDVDEPESLVDREIAEVAHRDGDGDPPRFAWSRPTIASEASIPWTRTPASASGMAMRPVPIPSSSAAPSPAISFRKATVAARSLPKTSSYLSS